jgi:hypothetical protein
MGSHGDDWRVYRPGAQRNALCSRLTARPMPLAMYVRRGRLEQGAEHVS